MYSCVMLINIFGHFSKESPHLSKTSTEFDEFLLKYIFYTKINQEIIINIINVGFNLASKLESEK